VSTDFFQLTQPDGQYVIINRAYIISLKPTDDSHKGEAILSLNKAAVGFASIYVMSHDVDPLKKWLLGR
jgi:hypothetical protein